MDSSGNKGARRKARESLGAIIQQIVTDESVLSGITRHYLEKIHGSRFQSLHRLFMEQARQLDGWLGAIGERARAIGIAALQRVDFRSKRSAVARVNAAPVPVLTMIGELLRLHEQMIARLRVDAKALPECAPDSRTVDLIAGLLEYHETTAWILRLLLDSPDPILGAAR
jgi:starvation-inducible DNA-binding protein